MIYVALLRGINVCGHNKMDMRGLKATFKSIGFTRVVSHLNSGNIIFEDREKNKNDIAKAAEKAIKDRFQLNIPVLVRDLKNIHVICIKLPINWVKDETMRTDVMFLWEKYDSPMVVKQLPLNPVDKVKYTKGAILWNVEGKNYSQSGVLKLAGTELFKHMTIRNVNTVRKIHQIMAGI